MRGWTQPRIVKIFLTPTLRISASVLLQDMSIMFKRGIIGNSFSLALSPDESIDISNGCRHKAASIRLTERKRRINDHEKLRPWPSPWVLRPSPALPSLPFVDMEVQEQDKVTFSTWNPSFFLIFEAQLQATLSEHMQNWLTCLFWRSRKPAPVPSNRGELSFVRRPFG